MFSYSNRRLFRGIVEQDQTALNYLYSNLFPKIKEMVIKNGGDYDTANDIFQEVIIIIYRKIKNGELSNSVKVQSYIYGMSSNIWAKLCNERNNQASMVEDRVDESDTEMLNEYRKNKRMNLFYKHFLQLKQECREILMAFFNGKSFTQIALEQDIASEEIARKKKYLCKEYLVKSIKSDPQFSSLIGEYDEEIFEID